MPSSMSQSDRAIIIFKENRNKGFTTKDIAKELYNRFPDAYAEKERQLAITKRVDIITQIAAEIGSQKDSIKKKCKEIHWHDAPKKKRVYWFGDANLFDDEVQVEGIEHKEMDTEPAEQKAEAAEEGWTGNEQDLYPLFNKYLNEFHDIYPLRIDEKRSKNSRGLGGNEWLHPDIAAFDPRDRKWDTPVKDCAHSSNGEVINIWSFEVKLNLTMGNVRKCYFQTVSNSSWATYGYLVALSIQSKDVLTELKMLNAIHGIGAIVFDPDDSSSTEITLPAKKRDQVDWDSVNRLAKENKDFNEFVANVSDYLKTGRIKRRDWSDID